LKSKQESEYNLAKEISQIEVNKQTQLMKIEVEKFSQLVKAIGRETIVAMAKAGPEQQAKLLKGLGLQGYLVSDGKNPINLFNAASGMINKQ